MLSQRICIALHGYLVRFLSNPKDTDSSVSAVNFTDRDLDAEELGGELLGDRCQIGKLPRNASASTWLLRFDQLGTA